MNKLMRDLRDSFMEVRPRFYRLEGLNAHRERRPQDAENNFTSELRRIHRNKMELPENQTLYGNLECDMTILKTLDGHTVVEPDLVIHAEQFNQARQEILVEVKARFNRISGLTDDLEKLELAISHRLKFRYAVMMVLNENLDRVETHIREFVGDRLNTRQLRRLYLFHAIRRGGEPTVYTFKNFRRIVAEN